MFELGPIIKSL